MTAPAQRLLALAINFSVWAALFYLVRLAL
jgi:hypothetical protein